MRGAGRWSLGGHGRGRTAGGCAPGRPRHHWLRRWLLSAVPLHPSNARRQLLTALQIGALWWLRRSSATRIRSPTLFVTSSRLATRVGIQTSNPRASRQDRPDLNSSQARPRSTNGRRRSTTLCGLGPHGAGSAAACPGWVQQRGEWDIRRIEDASDMPTADEVKALVRSHAEGDDGHFYAVAMQVAARAAKAGQTRFAQELRDVVDAAKAASQQAGTRRLRAVPVVQPKGDLAGLLGVSYPSHRMSDLVVSPEVRVSLERVLTEQRQQEHLREHGFDPLHSMLLIGPPGTGKTLSASVLAGELRLPLFLIRLETLITKFMGETAAKLRLIFDAVEQTRGVYLFD